MPPSRRLVLRSAAALPLLHFAPSRAAGDFPADLAAIERDLDGRIGLVALDTGSGKRLLHRSEERFPMCSTFKMILAAAVLQRSVATPELLKKTIAVTQADMRPHAPVTSEHVGGSLSVETLCDAIVRYSDNPAANLLLKEVGGPAALTAYARTIGDRDFRLDRWETELNSAIPGDPRDTTTPKAMAGTVHALLLGEALPALQRGMLKDWMLRNTTGTETIRAGLPATWAAAEKTGAGAYGARNDVGVLYPPGRAPIVLVVFTATAREQAESRTEIVAAVARLVAATL